MADGLSKRSAFFVGWLHGTATWLISVPWIERVLRVYGGLPRPAAVALVVLLAVYLGFYHGVFAGVGRWLVGGKARARAMFVLPALWVVLECLRAWVFSGFPWNLAGYALVEVPGALPLSAWIGSYGLSFLVVAVNVSLAALLVARFGVRQEVLVPAGPQPLDSALAREFLAGRLQDETESHGLLRAGLAAPTITFTLLVVAAASWSTEPSGAGSLDVRLVQPNIPIRDADTPAVELEREYQRLVEQAARACDRPGALVVLPEGALWPYSWHHHQRVQSDLGEIIARGCQLLIGGTTFEGAASRNGVVAVGESAEAPEEQVFNSALLLGPNGLEGRYDKMHLVPFGEYVPLKNVFSFLDSMARQAGDFSSGSSVRLLEVGEHKLGVSICFEVVFQTEVARRIAEGATILVTITNDAWYGDTQAPWQHLRAARFRAAENGRPMLRAALTGVSAIIAPDGRLAATLGVHERGVLEATVTSRHHKTLFSRAPWLIPVTALLILLVTIGFVVAGAIRERAQAAQS